MSIADAAERAAAVDPLRSFCVTAPAGSGKTELLIQRYLGLLARVERPEQVLAITFTRKAAAEMRERVMGALTDARDDAPVTSEHQRRTRSLAQAALEADARGGWQLAGGGRFSIMTIDSFCGALTRQMPVLSRFGGQVTVTEDAEPLYAEAVEALFARLSSGQPDLAALLSHFDNNWERVQTLLGKLLERRDQWREYVGVREDPARAEALLLHTARAVVEEELEPLAEALTPYADELLALQRYAAAQLGSEGLERFPGTAAEDCAGWRSLQTLLLTQQGKWRSRITKSEGFPAGKGEPAAWKERLTDLLELLREDDDIEAALAGVSYLPEVDSGARSWELAVHLAHLLPLLAAELLLVFTRRGQVDHSQVALSALEALGEDEAPTELALRLDYRIEHILVDEFQDTAISQFELVRRLTRGWAGHNEANPGAPRTVFIVGDGMQSIYGFRDANVGLFLKAQQEGFNGLRPESLALRCNFRSEQGIVDWVNRSFAAAFPDHNDVRRGQVSYTPAAPVKPAGAAPAVACHGFTGEAARDQEVGFFCDTVEQGIADPRCESIAVLGRSRSLLQPVLDELRRRGVDYAAQDMDSLAASPAVLDLLTLCRALSNPADRVAWLALLRAPWCGLDERDLHALGSQAGERGWRPIALAIADAQVLQGLSADGRERVHHLRRALDDAERSRDRLALRVWLEQVWLALGGPATLALPGQLQDAERFFLLLEEADQSGLGLDLRWLSGQCDKLRLSVESPRAQVQVMTLHRAKGLEFDWVLLPGLDRVGRSDERALMLWDDYTLADNRRGFLLAADDRAPDGEATLYNYLREQRRQKAALESTRLLYVGATRAMQRLVLGAGLAVDPRSGGFRSPGKAALLHPLWGSFREAMTVHEPAPVTAAGAPTSLLRLTRLPQPGRVGTSTAGDPNIPEPSLNRVERYVGTVVHLAMEHLALREALPAAVDERDRQTWSLALRRLGLAGESLDLALDRVTAAVERTLASDSGRWVLRRDHPQAQVEWPLSVAGPGGEVKDLVLDRCFVCRDSGVRWVIDYKTSVPGEGEAEAAFFARESEHYREQLTGYRDALRQLGPEPLRCALYFNQLGHLHHLAELDLPAEDTA